MPVTESLGDGSSSERTIKNAGRSGSSAPETVISSTLPTDSSIPPLALGPVSQMLTQGKGKSESGIPFTYGPS